ncbi:hypothetical protein RJ639_037112 [Escallonia herrerae]|uniref:GAG-pre-integrase domain-containing protein n=1 Tax=Escallonia herrerae TaxID=1293975 RepID=A0AA89BHE6_9ASTE|nr:hypothetical protein RJ639_037112 [Escallonia herrerae]
MVRMFSQLLSVPRMEGGFLIRFNPITCAPIETALPLIAHVIVAKFLWETISSGCIDRGASAITSSSGIDSDTTKLWHIRLGHMNERDMDVLSKQGLLGSKKIGKLDFVSIVSSGSSSGIVRHHTVRKMPQQNGVAGWMDRTPLERVRHMLSNAGLSKEFWAEVINTATYLVNRSPPATIDCKTPEKVWSSYASGVKGYQLWYLNSKSSKFLISRDVTFDESSMLLKEELIDAEKDYGAREKVELEVQALDSLPNIPTGKEDSSYSIEENEEPQEQQYSIARNKSRRETQPLQKYVYVDMVAYALSLAEGVEVQP